jgi:hypothetical protein
MLKFEPKPFTFYMHNKKKLITNHVKYTAKRCSTRLNFHHAESIVTDHLYIHRLLTLLLTAAGNTTIQDHTTERKLVGKESYTRGVLMAVRTHGLCKLWDILHSALPPINTVLSTFKRQLYSLPVYKALEQ